MEIERNGRNKQRIEGRWNNSGRNKGKCGKSTRIWDNDRDVESTFGLNPRINKNQYKQNQKLFFKTITNIREKKAATVSIIKDKDETVIMEEDSRKGGSK